MGRSLTLVVMLGLVMVPVVGRGAPAPITDAEAIFEQARSTWSNMTYPSLLDYRIFVQLTAAGATHVDHYRGEVEPATGQCRVHSFSDEEAAHPTTPHGINVILGSLRVNANTTQKPVSFGTPELSPLYSFGIRGGRRLIEEAETSALKTIGRVVTLARRYSVRLIERTALDGADTYHLALTPLADPGRYRLRELWVSTSTYDVVAARIRGNFTDRPATTVPWLIHFATIDGATYISSETVEEPLLNRRLTFDSVTIRFESIKPRHGSRDVLFALPNNFDASGDVHEPAEIDARGQAAQTC